MVDGIRPDVAFVLAALRCDAHAERAQRDAAAGVADWAAVARLALTHDVAWWVERALPSDGVPADAEGVLRATTRAVSVSALAGARQLAELHDALDHAGLRAVAYKGPALAADVHGAVGARRFTDLDLLIAEDDRTRAIAAMRALGYASPHGLSERAERVYSRWEGVTHLARADDLPVELHWRCQAPRYGGPQDPADVVARARPCALGGGAVLVPAPEDLGVLLALHGVKHGWSILMWLADFVAAVSRPGFDWDVFSARGAAWGVRRALHFAVLVARELTALEMPASVQADALRDDRAAFLAGAVSARLTMAADAPDIGAESTPRYDLQWLEGGWARVRYLALAAALPTPQERTRAPLPDALLPLVYPMRAWRLMRHALGRRA
ncbi:MAG: nucleotidyltransferase family protein [Gemmatimonadetes bacterium]|nr:nucleotidyltransferase family protein [Gemmatimonadota bacterium]